MARAGSRQRQARWQGSEACRGGRGARAAATPVKRAPSAPTGRGSPPPPVPLSVGPRDQGAPPPVQLPCFRSQALQESRMCNLGGGEWRMNVLSAGGLGRPFTDGGTPLGFGGQVTHRGARTRWGGRHVLHSHAPLQRPLLRRGTQGRNWL